MVFVVESYHFLFGLLKFLDFLRCTRLKSLSSSLIYFAPELNIVRKVFGMNIKITMNVLFFLFPYSFAPSDNKFTTCSDDGTVRIWDFQKCHEEKTLRGMYDSQNNFLLKKIIIEKCMQNYSENAEIWKRNKC